MNETEIPMGFTEFNREGVDVPRAFYEALSGGTILVCDVFFLLVIVTRPSFGERKEFIILAASILQDTFYGATFLDKGSFKIKWYYSGETSKFFGVSTSRGVCAVSKGRLVEFGRIFAQRVMRPPIVLLSPAQKTIHTLFKTARTIKLESRTKL